MCLLIHQGGGGQLVSQTTGCSTYPLPAVGQEGQTRLKMHGNRHGCTSCAKCSSARATCLVVSTRGWSDSLSMGGGSSTQCFAFEVKLLPARTFLRRTSGSACFSQFHAAKSAESRILSCFFGKLLSLTLHGHEQEGSKTKRNQEQRGSFSKMDVNGCKRNQCPPIPPTKPPSYVPVTGHPVDLWETKTRQR